MIWPPALLPKSSFAGVSQRQRLHVTQFNSSSAAVRTGLLWLDNTITSLHVRFEHGGLCLCCQAKGAQCVLQLMMNRIRFETYMEACACVVKPKEPSAYCS